MDNEPQYTIVRENGQMFHTDKDTIALLQAAERYDPTGDITTGQRSVLEFIFDHGRETGRIGEGAAHALEQQPDQRSPQPTPHVEHAQSL